MKHHKFRTGIKLLLRALVQRMFIFEMIKFKNQNLKTELFKMYVLVAVVALCDICKNYKFVSSFKRCHYITECQTQIAF